MGIYKRCGRCGKRIPSGTTCPCVKEYKKSKDKDYDKNRRNKERDSFYHSREWKRAREDCIRRHIGIDLYLYYEEGKIVPAEMAHHIETVEEAYCKRVDQNNLIPLSDKTHAQIHKWMKEGREQERKVQAILKGFLRKWERKENAEGEGVLKLF